tara:strand:+ start:3949 stop:4674 length:726 start_codon:yes stop_codon:yes gene_type:complete
MFIKKLRRLVEEFREKHKKEISLLRELDWANTYHDSIRGKVWLETLPLNIGRWAGNYTFFYVLNRVLSDYKPNTILEFGLGESTKFISSYLENMLFQSKHLVIEHDDNWKETFLKINKVSHRTKITIVPMREDVINNHIINCYEDLKSKIDLKYDLYVIDGPFGSPNFSRFDIVNLMSDFNEKDEFIVIFDDYNRLGEKETVNEIIDVLMNKNIKVFTASYEGSKSTMIITTTKYKYLITL